MAANGALPTRQKLYILTAMEDRTAEPTPAEVSPLAVAQAVREQRGKVREFVTTQRARIDRVETQLADELERLRRELNTEREKTNSVNQQVSQRVEELAQRKEDIDRLQEELLAREAELTSLQQRLRDEQAAHSAKTAEELSTIARQRAALAESIANIQEQAASLSLREEQLTASSEDLATRESALVTRETQLAMAEQQLSSEQVELRRRETELDERAARQSEQQVRLNAGLEKIAADQAVELTALRRCGELEAQLEELQSLVGEYQTRIEATTIARDRLQGEHEAEVAQQSATLEAVRANFNDKLARQATAITEIEAERDQVATDLKASRCEIDKLQATLATHQEQLGETQRRLLVLSDELECVRRQWEESTELLRERDAALSETSRELGAALARVSELQIEAGEKEREAARIASAEIGRFAAERQVLLLRLAEADARAEAASQAVGDDLRIADFERRYQLALDDLREQKTRIEELESKLREAGAPPARAGESLSGLDWEAQKRRLLASLESSEDEEDPTQVEERIQIRDAIAVTERVVAEKDREIERLQQLLEEGAAADKVEAENALAIAAVLDKDLSIQKERLKLEKLQQEWQEKLRQAEIDLSVERAAIARERAKVEEKLEQLRSERAQLPQEGTEADQPRRKPPRGRWLTRLGLRDPEEG